MKQVLISKGAAGFHEVPAPLAAPGEILVRVRASCLSVGTEMSGVRSSGVPMWKKAFQEPAKAMQALRLVSSIGLRRTWSLIEERREAAHPTGYSAAGIVEAVGEGVSDFAPGDRVACAGAQSAHHAEFIRVPRNLCVLLPDGQEWEEASTVTLGAIALQGVRRSEPTLGETFVVLGLGLLGQLTVQLLKANGCHVIGVDLDRSRIAMAEGLGMDVGLHPEDGSDAEQVARLTDGNGADAVIITAATPSDAVVSTAFRICRKKGRVVLVGDVGLHLNREDFYVKEIDFRISSSYGPGRYDARYEEQGFDYPIAYVRWTENRNMAEYLRLLAAGQVRIAPMVSGRYPVTEAEAAYASLSAPGAKPMMVLLSYPGNDGAPERVLRLGTGALRSSGKVAIAVVGTGAFARATHLPNLRSLGDRFALRAVVARSGHGAAAVARQYGAHYATTDPAEVLADSGVDAVIIATRHHLHGAMTLEALKAGKHVLVEKPLALRAEELDALEAFYAKAGGNAPLLLTGYNRRFSPYARRMAELLRGRSGPFMINYRMNAGYLPMNHWVHGPEGGGRNLGEACHIYDLFTFLTGAKATRVTAQSVSPASGHYGRNDNFTATVGFEDGSVASLTYTALGFGGFPKETAELYVDGKIVSLGDYRTLDVHGARARGLKTSSQEKGLREELAAFGDAILKGGDWPIPLWQQLQVARIGLLVEGQIQSRNGAPESSGS